MKRSRAGWLVVVIVLVFLALLVLFLPARWVLPLVQPRLHGLVLDGVHGLLWDGAADDLRGADGRVLGRLQWQLSRSALWGRLDLRADFRSPHLAASGRLRRDAQGRPAWSDVTLRADLTAWTPPIRSPWGTPHGTLSVAVERAVLQANWPVQLKGRAQWHEAAIQWHDENIALGDLAMDFDGASGVLHGQIRDEHPGPLHVAGQWQASPLGWRLDMLLQPRAADPALRRWLARLGQPDADGSVHLHRRGGLAAGSQGATQ